MSMSLWKVIVLVVIILRLKVCLFRLNSPGDIFNSSSAAYMRQLMGSALVDIVACRLVGAII